MGSHSVTCYPTQVNSPPLTPASKLVLDLPTPEGWKPELTYVDGYIPRWCTCPQTVTHASINRAWRRVTSLIETNALPLSQTMMHGGHTIVPCSVKRQVRQPTNRPCSTDGTPTWYVHYTMMVLRLSEKVDLFGYLETCWMQMQMCICMHKVSLLWFWHAEVLG